MFGLNFKLMKPLSCSVYIRSYTYWFCW